MAPAALVFGAAGATILGLSQTGVVDYDHVSDPTGAANTDRISYLLPKFSGFQAGVSYAPEAGQNAVGNNLAAMNTDNDVGDYEDIWEVAARWDGEFQGFGIGLGAGYSDSSLEATAAAPTKDVAPVINDDLTQWNAGVNLTWNSFSLGGAFLRAESGNLDRIDSFAVGGLGAPGAGTDDTSVNLDVEQDTWVVGLGWDNGPYHLGASWLNQEISRDSSGVAADDGEIAALNAETERFTVGGGYTFGPGMTFRGAVAWGPVFNDP